MDFGRQPQPVKISLVGENDDINPLVFELKKWLNQRFDNVDGYITGGGYELRCYPRAVND